MNSQPIICNHTVQALWGDVALVPAACVELERTGECHSNPGAKTEGGPVQRLEVEGVFYIQP